LSAFAVTSVRENDALVVRIAGDLDLSTAGDLARLLELECPGDADLVIDLSGVTFLDCAGLRVLLRARARVDGGGGSLRLVPGPPAVQRVMGLARLDARLRSEGQRAYSSSNTAA
jgi:anti-anti-sigma factor